MFQKGSLVHSALNASDLRQKAISNNLANVNTAGYKVDKVEFEDKLRQAITADGGLSLSRTNDKHLFGNGVTNMQPEVKKRLNTSVKENGNNVDVDIEMTEKAANELYYNTLIKQLNGKYSMYNYVINN